MLKLTYTTIFLNPEERSLCQKSAFLTHICLQSKGLHHQVATIGKGKFEFVAKTQFLCFITYGLWVSKGRVQA